MKRILKMSLGVAVTSLLFLTGCGEKVKKVLLVKIHKKQ